MHTTYSKKERWALIAMGAIGLVILNTVFLYCLFYSPQTIWDSLRNPVSLVFIGETFLMLGLLSYLLEKWEVTSISWKWFLVLSLLGSMAFALPVALLWKSGPSKIPK